MAKKGKTRRLWLNVKLSIPASVGRLKPVDRKRIVKQVLLDSLDSDDYSLPRGYSAEINWRNKELAPMRVGEWQNELLDSASSEGFEQAVRAWIERS